MTSVNKFTFFNQNNDTAVRQKIHPPKKEIVHKVIFDESERKANLEHLILKSGHNHPESQTFRTNVQKDRGELKPGGWEWLEREGNGWKVLREERTRG